MNSNININININISIDTNTTIKSVINPNTLTSASNKINRHIILISITLNQYQCYSEY